MVNGRETATFNTRSEHGVYPTAPFSRTSFGYQVYFIQRKGTSALSARLYDRHSANDLVTAILLTYAI